uniref:PHD finger protein 20-like protein 1 n=1 Tax=Lygus hesperus TaxID=30085 RepID=A0A0A9VZB4_LYGHE
MSSLVVHDKQSSLVPSNEPDNQEHLIKADTKIHSAHVVLVDFKKSSKGGHISSDIDHVAEDVKPQRGANKTDEVCYSSDIDVSAVSEKSEDSSSMEVPTKGKITKRKSLSLRRQKLESSLKTKSSSSKLCVNFPALKKSKKPDLSDDNTTNSEASEGNTLYHDVDWEGNLDNDAQLDEFAPRRRCESPDEASHPGKMEVEESQMSSAGSSHSGSHYHNRFEAGEKVRVHNYNNSSWEEGVVEEIDDYEQEVLVVSNGRKEWVNINSHRISKVPKNLPRDGQDSRPNNPKVTQGSIIEPKVISALEKSVPVGKAKSEAEPGVRKSLREGAHSLPKKDSLFLKNKKLDKMKRKRSVPKRKEAVVPSKSVVPAYTPKFKENEKVLAKWSNHRMQKFPAVIRKVNGQGEYDVLFYDGFVKTISEEHIYKATEEECEKYQGANPSKADSFVEMDEDSKEARRQRKKKTFDDYLSPKDFERPRRKFLPGESGVRRLIKQKRSVGVKRLQSKIGFSRRRRTFKPKVQPPKPSTDEAAAEEFVVDVDAEPESSTGVPDEPVVLEEKPAEVTEPDTADLPPVSQDLPATEGPAPPELVAPVTSPVKESPVNSELPDEDKPLEPPALQESTATAKQEIEPAPSSPLPPLPVVYPKVADYGDRFLCDPPEGAAPISIKTKDGTCHQSIIIGDKNLLPGWKKHAVFIRGKQQVFLISPEGYKINSKLDLYDYHNRTLKVPPPPVLDFIVDTRVIPTLREKQKDMQIPAIRYPTWKIKRGKGGPRQGSRKGNKLSTFKMKNPIKAGPAVPKVGGKVRTLLPRYRYEPIPLQPPEPEKETVWNCPKEGCGKTFRKESLLQMHVKHYHASEFSALIGTAPNVVDLALARSESNYAESLKPQFLPVKRPSSKTSPHVGLTERNDSEYSSSPAQGSISPQVGTSFMEDLSSIKTILPKRPTPSGEERRSTIKTLLPTRQPTMESNESVIMDSDDFDSEDEYVKLQKQRTKKMRYDHMDSYTEEEKGSPVELTEDGVIIERLRSEEIINCTCLFREEDGLMIQCDICMCWQHGICSGIESDVEVPERYVCYICRHPPRVRSSVNIITLSTT